MADYGSKKVAELKELLKEAGLSTAGNKATLVARLEEAEAPISEIEEPTPDADGDLEEGDESPAPDESADESADEPEKVAEKAATPEDVVAAVEAWVRASDDPESVFSAMDTNSDGRVSGPEFQSWLATAEIADLAPPDVMASMGLIDLNKDGYIDLTELRVLVGELAAPSPPPTAPSSPVEWVKEAWATEKSMLSTALPWLPFLEGQPANRAVMIGSSLGVLGLLFNAMFGLAREVEGGARDHAVDLTALLFGVGDVNAVRAPNLDPISFCLIVLLSLTFWFTQPDDES